MHGFHLISLFILTQLSSWFFFFWVLLLNLNHSSRDLFKILAYLSFSIQISLIYGLSYSILFSSTFSEWDWQMDPTELFSFIIKLSNSEKKLPFRWEGLKIIIWCQFSCFLVSILFFNWIIFFHLIFKCLLIHLLNLIFFDLIILFCSISGKWRRITIKMLIIFLFLNTFY